MPLSRPVPTRQDRGAGPAPAVPGSAPAAAPRAGALQGTALLALSCLSVLGAVLIAPVQPAIVASFPDQPGVDVLVPMSLTVPALLIAVVAPFAGRLVDRVGRVRLLVVSLVLYSLFGTAPLWLDALPAIVASRALVGVAEAGIMVAVVTLIGDLFDGVRRTQLFGLQSVATSASAVVFIGAGGALGATSWRAPFWLYAVGLLAAVVTPLVLREPASVERALTGPGGSGLAGAVAPLDLRSLRWPLLVTFVGGIIFYTPLVQLSFALDSIGVTSTAVIGAVSAAAAVATCAAAASFSRWGARRGAGERTLLPLALALAGAGLVVIALASSVPVMLVGAVVCSAGTGLLLPTVLAWTLGDVPLEQRGRATGLWTSCLFIGQFLNPLVVQALHSALSELAAALAVVAVLSLALAAFVVAVTRDRTVRGVAAGHQPR
ncbi:MFS transporter [Quadrisphaera setariae]|uniref:MFS transporter n=1 Tax=Quadrisphaera setariae TaxID=2593304 RepID=A0A5C8ZJL9_9ACTN|nr:MFS transporter [Quadrisphaera setariae]TXR57040.1 MFS transporter [Quadrisphaera setariae]